MIINLYPRKILRHVSVSGCKESNDIDFHSSETKSSLSIANIENINSNNLDNVSKSMETVEETENTFDDGK